VIGLLKKKGAVVSYHDPLIKQVQHDEWNLQSVADLDKAVSDADCVVIVTNHSTYDYPGILNKARLIVDTRNALGASGKNNPKVVRL